MAMEKLTSLQGSEAALVVALGIFGASWLYYWLRRWKAVNEVRRHLMDESLNSDLSAPDVSYPKVDRKFAREVVGNPQISAWRAEETSDLRRHELSYRERLHARVGVRNPATGEAISRSPNHRSKTVKAERVMDAASAGHSLGTIYLQSDGRLVKIGMTARSSKARMKSYARYHRLVGRYELVREWQHVKNFKYVESVIHLELARFRISHGMRELYLMPEAEAINVIEKVLRAQSNKQ